MVGRDLADAFDLVVPESFRIVNGQDPEKNPEKFTPLVDQRMKWPTDKEAYAWAEAAKENSRKRPLFGAVERKKPKTPCGAAGSTSTPKTDEAAAAAAASSSYAGPAVPMQL